MKAQHKKSPSCVLVYSDDRDPSREETAEVLTVTTMPLFGEHPGT